MPWNDALSFEISLNPQEQHAAGPGMQIQNPNTLL